MLTTYMNPQLTRLDVVTTEDGYLLVLNQVMELKKQKIEHVEAFIKEHKFKPIIMKKIAWNEPAQPAIREDYLLEMVKLANELSGMDNTLTKREALLVCMGFTTGEAYVYGKYGINK